MQPISEEQEYSPSNTVESFVKSTDVDAESQDESLKVDLRERLMKAVNSQNLEQITHILEEVFYSVNIKIKCEQKDCGEIVNDFGTTGWSAYHCSIYTGNLGICQELLAHGADVNKPTQEGWTPLQLCINKNHRELMKLILQSPKILVNEVSQKGCALHLALQQNKVELSEILINNNADLE